MEIGLVVSFRSGLVQTGAGCELQAQGVVQLSQVEIGTGRMCEMWKAHKRGVRCIG